MKNDTFVRLDSPVSVRKEVLKTAIDATKILKSYEEHKKMKVRNDELVVGFKTNLEEINAMLNSLTSKLPRVHEEKPKEVKKEEKPVQEKAVKEQPKKEVKPKEIKPKVVPKSKVDIELEEIERKLQSIEV